MTAFDAALDELSDRRILLVGGKGGVGKTTIAKAAAAHFPNAILLDVAALDANALYRKFLGDHLESFLEIGDRGTYLDREELRRLFELAIPGVDELMTWMHIGELAEEHPMVIVDTAPTGHTLRMLSSSGHFHQLALALDSMQEKHRAMVRQFTRRDVRDALDAFIEDFDARAVRRRELLEKSGVFVAVTLSEPLVVEQTVRLIGEVGISVPFVVLNRAVMDPDCALDTVRVERDNAARVRFSRVVDYPRDCMWSAEATPPLSYSREYKSGGVASALHMFFAGKGGVGKTSCATSTALQLANNNPHHHYTIISVDPAHSLKDLFATQPPPSNLTVEAIDTKAKWRRFRASLGVEIENAFSALAPRGLTIAHDQEAMRSLIEIAPPGADELFAITRLADLVADESLAGVIVDTAPTGHFLRLLELPRAAGEWVREFMRLLLRYKDLIPPGSLGEELVRASRALRELETALHSENTSVIVVTRPEPEVVDETKRLMATLRERGLRIGGVIANYVTPDNECACDRAVRARELSILADLEDATLIERRDAPPQTLADLATLVPLSLRS